MKQQNHHPNRPEQTHRNPQAAILSLLVGAAMLLLALVACTPNSDLDPAAAPAAPGAVTTLIGTKPAYTPLPATRTATNDDNGAWQTGDQVTVSIRFYTTPDAPALATPAAETQQTLTYTATAATTPASRWTASPAIVAIPAAARSMRVGYTYQGTADPITATSERMKAYVTEATGSAISPDDPTAPFRPTADANDRLIPIGNVSGTLTLTPAFERLTALVSLDMQPAQHVLLTTALPQPGITPDHNGLYTLSAHIDATAQPATAHFHLMATAPADAADATFGLRIEGEAKTAYPAVPYRTGWKYHLDARSILSSGSGNGGQDQQFVTTNAETDDLDPKIFNAKNPVWIITGGGKDDDAAQVVTDKVKAALQGLPAGSIELVLADVKTVGNNAFNGCTALNSVSLPAAESIGETAFEGCTALANIDLKAAKSIGQQAFYRCTALATIDLTAAESIGSNAFFNCTALTNIDLPAAESIGSNAFLSCTALTNIDLKAAKSIGSDAFRGCTALANIDLKAVKSIGQQAFQGCTALTNIDLKAAESIGENAFQSCTALATVNLPATVTTIEDNAFGNCAALANIDLTAVKSIGQQAFQGCTVLATIDLPAVKSIGISAFGGCAALTTVVAPQVNDIGQGAFYNCTTLATVTLPETVTAIETQVFEGCAALTTIDLPAVKSIGNQAFQNCAALTTVVAPQVNNIGQGAFYNCTNLTQLQLTARGNITLDDYAFFNFNTAACTLTLNSDKKSDATGTATPKEVDGDKWWKDGRGTPAQWQQIDYTSTTPTTSTPAVDLPGITDGGKPY